MIWILQNKRKKKNIDLCILYTAAIGVRRNNHLKQKYRARKNKQTLGVPNLCRGCEKRPFSTSERKQKSGVDSCFVIWDKFNIVVRLHHKTHACNKTHAFYDMSYHNVKLVSNYKTTVYKRRVWWGTVADRPPIFPSFHGWHFFPWSFIMKS